MIFEDVFPIISDISKALRGREIKLGDHRPYDQEIDSLIETVGFDEFFKNAEIPVKIEFLSVCSNRNFDKLIDNVNLKDFWKIIIVSEIDDLREILKRLLMVNQESNFKYWDFIYQNIDEVDKIDNTKKLLLQGYLSEFRKRRSAPEKENESISDEETVSSNLKRILSEYDQLKIDHANTVAELKSHIADLEEKNKENIQNRIDKNLSIYVQDSVLALSKIEKKLKCAAARWSALSVFILFSGFAAGIGFSLFGYAFGPDLQNLKWPELLIFSIKGIFIVSAFVAAAGYSFMKSNAFTHEAIIVSNRAHAIQFGQLYLDIYGNTVERGEMQKIFENWNISSDTAFLKHKNDKSDPVKFSEFLDSLKKVKELIPSISKD
ncbi:hypothetical protein [Comamonas sp. AG1104]|uniref:hypothetical protein n=1 Tax=Comamonas sp. AG1104 TaxID=2183900 RepID=UPI000E0B5C88|nr:hypothetical protein [Comamonas sp. AG1104]RDI10573.1 hypothetical protein DFO48_10583 [Comamonas sp. AG1104]